MIRVYHGSNEAIEKPLVNIGRPYLDFGTGFYICITRQEVVDRYMHFVESVQVKAYAE